MEIKRVGVVGCGLMGSGIAEVCARAGLDVIVREVDAAVAERGRVRIESSLARAVDAGKLAAEDRDRTLGQIQLTTDIADLADRQLVIEAVVEVEDEKMHIFSQLDKVIESDSAILASNTSSIPIMKLAMATTRPESVLGMHFFNPVPVMRLVELVPSLLTGQDVIDVAQAFVSAVLGKQVIACKDRAGFVVNALLVPFLLSGIRMLESGFATAEDIDTGLVLGCRHPMGPLALADLIGLDTVAAIAQSLYEEFKEPLFAPPPMLSRMVEAGLLGRKAGQGFHEYA